MVLYIPAVGACKMEALVVLVPCMPVFVVEEETA